MRGIGGLLAAYGFLSAVLYFFEYHITLLSWADKWQPGFGLIVGCAGMVFLGISLWTHKEEPSAPQPQDGQYATPGAPPMIGQPGPQGPMNPPSGPMAAPMAGPQSGPPSGPMAAPGGPGPNRIPQQGPQYGQRPPQGPPPQGPPPGRPGYPPPYPQQPPHAGPGGFGPQGGPPYGPRG